MSIWRTESEVPVALDIGVEAVVRGLSREDMEGAEADAGRLPWAGRHIMQRLAGAPAESVPALLDALTDDEDDARRAMMAYLRRLSLSVVRRGLVSLDGRTDSPMDLLSALRPSIHDDVLAQLDKAIRDASELSDSGKGPSA